MQRDDLGELLSEVEGYIGGLFSPQDHALEAALEESRRAGLPEIHISPAQGRLMQFLAELGGARRVLEIGTLGGYSAIYLARALPEDGEMISLELEEDHARVARANLERAGLDTKVEVRVGDARESLDKIQASEEGPFDLVFIDADKEAYPEYLDYALRLTRPGSVIMADNTIWGGAVMDDSDEEGSALHEFNRRLASEGRLSATIIPLLRERVDGLAVARVI
ncbi:O-methyltransferase [Rubrobacter aplysinae]|uniref:O-methyltransferase n=1 Tax=Rubrobacter aplysinae TaxID=909625 RepID=UPI00064B8F57|nr:O-methyltransferase [Rubrobacter aplysinae]